MFVDAHHLIDSPDLFYNPLHQLLFLSLPAIPQWRNKEKEENRKYIHNQQHLIKKLITTTRIIL